jgi:hypothetical protein
MPRLFCILALLVAALQAVATAQEYEAYPPQPYYAYPPGGQPIPPGYEYTQNPAELPPQAGSELLATRSFDFLVSLVQGPLLWPHGSMEDPAISLGEYARRIRARRVPLHAPVITPYDAPAPRQ